MRKYAGFWAWPDKRRKELGVVEELFEAMRWGGIQEYQSPENAPEDPPDCTMRAADGSLAAVEVTELVCQEAARRNHNGERIYRDWQPVEVLQQVKDRLQAKDAKVYRGGPYSKIVAIVYTDEPVLTYASHQNLFAAESFGPFAQIQEAYFLFSYDPNYNYYPYVQLRLVGKSTDEA